MLKITNKLYVISENLKKIALVDTLFNRITFCHFKHRRRGLECDGQVLRTVSKVSFDFPKTIWGLLLFASTEWNGKGMSNGGPKCELLLPVSSISYFLNSLTFDFNRKLRNELEKPWKNLFHLHIMLKMNEFLIAINRFHDFMALLFIKIIYWSVFLLLISYGL